MCLHKGENEKLPIFTSRLGRKSGFLRRVSSHDIILLNRKFFFHTTAQKVEAELIQELTAARISIKE